MPAAPLYPVKAWLPAPLYWPYRGIRALGVGFCFAAFWSVAVLLGWIWVPLLMIWPGTRDQRIHRTLTSVRAGFKLFHFVMRLLRLYHCTSPYATLRPHGEPATNARILVANHPSLCDTTAVCSLFPNVVAVARTGFADNFLLRRLIRATGFIPLGTHVLKGCEERLRSGFDVLIFPEGTRSPREGGVHPFHRGAFELAIRTKVPIVLIKLTCEPRALTKRLPIWKHPDHMAILTIEPVDTIDPATLGIPSRELSSAIEQRYREMLG